MYFTGVNPIKMASIDFDMFFKFYLAAFVRTSFAKVTKGKKLRMPVYVGHLVRSHNAGNEILKQMIFSGKPFMFGRNGSSESTITGQGIMLDKKIIDDFSFDISLACKHCGYFGNVDKESIIKFSHTIEDATSQSDLFGTFRWIWEDYIIKHYAPQNVVLTHANNMDFWRYEKPFTCALKGKKVLVIHPFAEQIEAQYKKREFLFKNPDWLPEFQLQTMKPVQTITGVKDLRFNDWFEALEYMKKEVERYDFDIALLACGAYGMPLTAHIKRIGKQAIYVGGVLQMLFGIRGNRWDKIPEARALYNEYWVSPEAMYKPEKSEIVEGGCYW